METGLVNSVLRLGDKRPQISKAASFENLCRNLLLLRFAVFYLPVSGRYLQISIDSSLGHQISSLLRRWYSLVVGACSVGVGASCRVACWKSDSPDASRCAAVPPDSIVGQSASSIACGGRGLCYTGIVPHIRFRRSGMVSREICDGG